MLKTLKQMAKFKLQSYIEDRYDEDGEETGKIEKILNELALKAIEKPALLQPHVEKRIGDAHKIITFIF